MKVATIRAGFSGLATAKVLTALDHDVTGAVSADPGRRWRDRPGGELRDHTATNGRHVVGVGYGKSACDVAVEVSKTASSTTVVTRELLWKLPRKLGGVLNDTFLMLTRLGEGLFRHGSVSGAERVLHAHDSTVANGILGSVAAVRQLG